MSDLIINKDDLKFRSGSTCMISGPTSSGKSTLLYQILKQAPNMFTSKPKQIIYCYGIYQSLYDQIKRTIPHIVFFEGIPTSSDLETWATLEPGHKILVLDDLLQRAAKSIDVVDLFCQYSHHLNFSTFFLVQNLFANSKQFRTISLNTHYFLLLAQTRDSLQIQAFGKQIFGSQVNYFMDAYKKATAPRFGYLLVDVHPQGSVYKLRTHILEQQMMSVFLPENRKP